ncbi:MAG: MFS transporter [Myxococcales bacterium]|nr:MFS transporter [Myxococcales bacterium]
MSGPELDRATMRWYGVGQAAEGIKNYSFAVFLLFYFNQVLGLSGTLCGVALAVALAFDAITDPLAGTLSDRLDSRWGRRHPFMYASAVPLGLFFALLFTPPAALGQWGLFCWLTSFAVLTRFAMTLYHVPHLALGAELTDDYDQRSRVVLIRSLGSFAGTAFTAGMALLYFMQPSAAYPDGRLNPDAYPAYALFAAVIMAVSILASAAGTHWRIPYLPRPAETFERTGIAWRVIADVRAALAVRPFRFLFIATLLIFTAGGVANNLNLYSGIYFWQIDTREMAAYGAFLGIGTVVGMIFWTRVSHRIDKKPTFLLGLFIFTVFVSFPPICKAIGLFPPRESSAYLPLFTLCGTLFAFGVAGPTVMGGSMMADITDADEVSSGRRREGIFFGALALVAKASVALGSIIAGRVVDLVGLFPGTDPSEVAPEVARQLGLVQGGTLLVLVSLSLAALSRYDLTREAHQRIRQTLDARAAEANLGGRSPE